jgi:hypothetical protein
MKLRNPVSSVVTSSLRRLLGLAFGAAYLALVGCSTNQAGTPQAGVNYIELRPAASNQQTSDSDPGYEWFY